jgi:hypothetical protein
MRPKLLKVIGNPVPKMIKASDSYEKLNEVVRLFNKNKLLYLCGGPNKPGCTKNDSSAYLVTIERMGLLGCGCQQQPK